MKFTLPEKSERAEYVQGRFTEIASRYDLFNDLVTQGMHRFWKNFLVKKSGLRPGDAALDMCCGTGDITERLLEKAGPAGRVVGLDFSEGMLSVAKARSEHKSVKPEFVQGDAMDLPFEDNSMDVITVGYGLRNIIDLDKSLTEVYRVLKPGGRFLSLDMGKVEKPVLDKLFKTYFFKVVPKVGRILYPGQDMFDYFPQSTIEFPSPSAMSKILKGIGFTPVEYYLFAFGANAVHLAVKPDMDQ